MIPRYVSETAEQLSHENPVNFAIVIIYFAVITLISWYIVTKVFNE